MSLVDYAGSSSEDEGDGEGEGEGAGDQNNKKRDESTVALLPPPNPHNPRNSITPSSQPSGSVSALPPPMMEKLPDASLLLSSPSFSSQHTSNTAMTSSALRKRESNGSSFLPPRSKHSRGNLPHSRNVPETVGKLLVPPQLSGRSNVVTEDISKLFVKRENQSITDSNQSSGD